MSYLPLSHIAAQGIDVGKSLCEHDMTETAKAIAEKAVETGCELLLPRACFER